MSTIKMTGPTPPSGRPHKTIKDQQSAFAKITAKTPVDEAFRAAFIKSKMRIAHTHPGIGLAERDLAVQSLADAWVRRHGSFSLNRFPVASAMASSTRPPTRRVGVLARL